MIPLHINRSTVQPEETLHTSLHEVTTIGGRSWDYPEPAFGVVMLFEQQSDSLELFGAVHAQILYHAENTIEVAEITSPMLFGLQTN